MQRTSTASTPSCMSFPRGASAAALALLLGLVPVPGCGPVEEDPAEEAVCGDGVRQESEICDEEDLGQESCQSLGFLSGNLACSTGCQAFDTSGCEGCGNGRVDPGETSENCCADAGCPLGSCNPESMECMDPWLIECPDSSAGSCSSMQPWFCPLSGLPDYDCQRCGCPTGKVCQEGFCYETEVIAAERNDRMPRLDLPLGRYLWIYDWLMSAPALTLTDLSDRLDAFMREDKRQVALLLGESHGSEDEQAVGVQLMRNLQGAGWTISGIGIEINTLAPALLEGMDIPHEIIDGDLTNTAYCQAATTEVSGRLNDSDGLYVQFTGSGHTSREVAYHEANWRVSQVPHTAECITRQSQKAVTVILFDPLVWFMNTDLSLLWRVGNYFPSEAGVETALEDAIERWWVTMDAQVREEGYDTLADGSEVNVRLVEARTPRVFFAYFPRPSRPAYFLQGYRTLWQEEEIRTFLLSNAIQPGNCSISYNLTPGEEMLWFWCSKESKSVNATVDATDFTLVEWELSP